MPEFTGSQRSFSQTVVGSIDWYWGAGVPGEEGGQLQTISTCKRGMPDPPLSKDTPECKWLYHAFLDPVKPVSNPSESTSLFLSTYSRILSLLRTFLSNK